MYVCNPPPPQGHVWLDEVVNNLPGVTEVHLKSCLTDQSVEAESWANANANAMHIFSDALALPTDV